MAVHPNGLGSSWVEDIDIDQPHGLDYRSWNHLAIAVRKRMASGHTAFADSTAGGVHIPGGAGVLGMEITHQGGDVTGTVEDNTTYQGHGLVWAYDGSADARLWCCTAVAESTGVDWTVMKLNPALQYDSTATIDWSCVQSFGYDVSIAGALYVDSSVDISGPVTIDGSTSVNVALDASVANIGGTLTCLSSAYFTNDVSMKADLVVDGTAVFTTKVDISGNLTVSGDASGSNFASAWALADWTTNTIRASCNVANVDWSSDGIVCVSFNNNLASNKYAVLLTGYDSTSAIGSSGDNCLICASRTTSGFRVLQSNSNFTVSNEFSEFNFLVFI